MRDNDPNFTLGNTKTGSKEREFGIYCDNESINLKTASDYNSSLKRNDQSAYTDKYLKFAAQN